MMIDLRNIKQVVRQKFEALTRANASQSTGRNKATPLFYTLMLGGILTASAYAQGKADQYMYISMKQLFSDTKQFECDGSNLSAVCTAKHYKSPDMPFALHDFRYTVNYRDTRVAERFSGNITFDSDTKFKEFLPKRFECADFTQINDEKQQVGKQTVCTIDTDSFRLWFRLRANAKSSLFANQDMLTLSGQTALVLNQLMHVANNQDSQDGLIKDLKNILNKIDVNPYGIDIAITHSQLPQKFYENIFADKILDDTVSSDSNKENTLLSQMIFNSSIGYIYGYGAGYVWGNDNLTYRTKDGLQKLLVALKDFSMLDTNIKALYVTIINRTKKGFTLAYLLDSLMETSDTLRELQHYTDLSDIFDIFSDDVLNRYRIEVQALRGK